MIPEISVNLCLGKLLAIHLPIRTPRRLVEIRASAAPMKIIMGLPDCAERINVASCVLSPNSAKKIVLKDVISILKKGLESSCKLVSSSEFELD